MALTLGSSPAPVTIQSGLQVSHTLLAPICPRCTRWHINSKPLLLSHPSRPWIRRVCQSPPQCRRVSSSSSNHNNNNNRDQDCAKHRLHRRSLWLQSRSTLTLSSRSSKSPPPMLGISDSLRLPQLHTPRSSTCLYHTPRVDRVHRDRTRDTTPRRPLQRRMAINKVPHHQRHSTANALPTLPLMTPWIARLAMTWDPCHIRLKPPSWCTLTRGSRLALLQHH